MRVGVLGSANVGRALGRGFASRGHDVMIGSRSPDSKHLREWVTEGGGKRSAGTPAQAAAHGEVIVLATLGAATEEAIDLAGPRNFDGKVVIDVTNPLDVSKMPVGLFVGTTDSLGERIQRKIPKAKVVKCFNTISSTQMVDPKLSVPAPEMLIAGNDAVAEKRVAGILKEFGWAGGIDVGGIDGARWLEAMVPLWVRVGSTLGTWGHGFQVARP